jgi:hypothetical protein
MRRFFREAGCLEPEDHGYTILPGLPGPSGPGGPPDCPQERILYYFDELGNPLAEAEEYLKADGSPGASGTPDPKRVRVGDTLYRYKRPS